MNRASREARRKETAEPEVSIFFVYDGRVLVDGASVSQAEPYGTFKVHSRGEIARLGRV